MSGGIAITPARSSSRGLQGSGKRKSQTPGQSVGAVEPNREERRQVAAGGNAWGRFALSWDEFDTRRIPCAINCCDVPLR
jgi:hypothetical protein